MSIFATTDFLIEVVKGNIEGHSIVHKFGRSDAVPNGSFIKLDFTLNPAFLTAPTKVIVRGNDPQDAAGGLNARSVIIEGIASDLTRKSNTLITAGASDSVASVDSFWRVDRVFVETVGSYGVTNGNFLVIRPDDLSVDIIGIAPGHGQSQHSAFTVPIGFTAQFLGSLITVESNKPANVRLFRRDNFNNTTAPMSPIRIVQNFDGVNDFVSFQPRSPQNFEALTDIWFEASGSGQTTKVSVDFELLLIDNNFI